MWRKLLDETPSLGLKLSEQSSAVERTLFSRHQAASLETADVMRQAAAGLDAHVGKIGHAHPLTGCFGEQHEDAVVVVGGAVSLQVLFEPCRQAL